jgi:hypothetical protein
LYITSVAGAGDAKFNVTMGVMEEYVMTTFPNCKKMTKSGYVQIPFL